jgi:hypothetical protein
VAKIFLVRRAILVIITINMKRIYALIVLLGLVVGAVVTGCEQKPADTTGGGATNAPMPAPASTNK